MQSSSCCFRIHLQSDYSGTVAPLLKPIDFNVIESDQKSMLVSIEKDNASVVDSLRKISTKFDKNDKSEAKYLMAIEALIRSIVPISVIADIEPLHSDELLNEVTRDTLWGGWFMGSLDILRGYYGTIVAFYSAWMKWYNSQLVVLSIFGLAIYYFRNPEISVADSPLMPLYSLFVVLWATVFPILWKRRSNELALHWGTYGFEKERMEKEMSVRVGFRGLDRVSPITGEIEVYFSPNTRIFRQVVSLICTVLLLCVALGVMICSLNLQGYIKDSTDLLHVPMLHSLSLDGAPLDQNGWFFFVPPLLHTIAIAILNTIYCSVAEILTEWENYRTEGEYKNGIILKRFIFEAVDCYLPLIYLALFRMDVELLRSELVSLYIADEVRRVIVEAIVPYLMLKWEGGKSPEDEYDSFDDYLEMVIQYGYVVLFAAAFPLAPILSLLGNLIEIRSDLFRLGKVFKRPMPRKASGIGRWENIISIISWLSIATNSYIFAFGSDQIETLFPTLFRSGVEGRGFDGIVAGQGRYVILIVVAIEHGLVLFALLMKLIIPTESSDVRNKVERIKYFAKKNE